MMRREALTAVLFIIFSLTIFSFISHVSSSNLNFETESIRIYSGSSSIYVISSFFNSSEIYNWFTNSIFNDQRGIMDVVKLSFINVRDWKPVHSYFLDGIWYNTNVKYIPSSSSYLLVKTIQNNSQDDTINLVDNVGDYFYLSFKIENSSDNQHLFISPYGHSVTFSKVSKLFDIDNVAIFEWLPLNTFEDKDFYNITVRIDFNNKVGDLIVSFIDFKEGGITSYFNLLNWKKVENDTRNIYIDIWSRFAYISRYPNIYNISIIDPNSLYVELKANVFGNSSINPFDIDVEYDLPILYVERTFSNTNLKTGDEVEITIKIRNIGNVDANNIIFAESPWWDNVSLTLVNGEIKGNFSQLPKDTEKILRYRIRVDTRDLKDIYVPPATATVELLNDLPLTFKSNTQYLHINYDSPFLYISIEPSSTKVSVGDDYTYDLSVSNLGNSEALGLQLGDFLVESIGPGETKKIELKSSVENPFDVLKKIYAGVAYHFKNKTYILDSPQYTLLFKPDKIALPQAFVKVKYEILNASYVNAFITIDNVGINDIESMNIRGQILGSFEYVSGDFVSSSSDKVSIERITLNVDESIEYQALFSISGFETNIYPIFMVELPQAFIKIVRYGNIDIFYNNSIKLFKVVDEPPYLVGLTYRYNLTIDNLGDMPLYNVTLRYDNQTSVNVINQSSILISNLVERGLQEKLNLVFLSESSGSFDLPWVEVSFILGGKLRKFKFNEIPVSFVEGIKVSLNLNKNRIYENDNLSLIMNLISDCSSCISYVNITISLPQGLTFMDSSMFKSQIITLSDNRTRFELGIKTSSPGKYDISDIEVIYDFKGKKVDYEDQYKKTLGITIEVKENIIKRYYPYFLISILISLILAIYIRKRVLS